MTRLRILFDADDVAETLLEGWVKTLNERYGTATSVEDVTDWDISKAFPTLTKQQIYGVLQEDEVWANLTPHLPGVSTPFKNVIFRRNGMSFFAGQHTGVYSLNH